MKRLLCLRTNLQQVTRAIKSNVACSVLKHLALIQGIWINKSTISLCDPMRDIRKTITITELEVPSSNKGARTYIG